jgi:beta-lactamase superfamily II metal-dependent hydrolase
MKILSYVFTLLLTIFVATPAVAAPEVAPSERVRRNVVIRASPDGDAARLGRLMPGEHLALEGETAGWYQVRLPDGQVGFVSKAWTVIIGTGSQPLTEGAQRYRVHVIDVGTGLAVFIEGPGFTMLYDGGIVHSLAFRDAFEIIPPD